jgi:membrane protein
MGALIDGLNVAYKARERRSFLRLRGIMMAFTAAALVFALSVLALLVVAPLILDALGWDPVFGPFAWIRWPALAAMAAIGFSILYRYAPSLAPERCRWVTSGAALAAVTWVGGSAALSFYIDDIAHYDVTYGSIAAVIGFMMWIWLSVMAVLVGAELNNEIETAATA